MKRAVFLLLVFLLLTLSSSGKARAAGSIIVDSITPGRAGSWGWQSWNWRTTTGTTRNGVHGYASSALHLQSETVRVTIDDNIAKTYIVQTFVNHGSDDLAGTYLLLLPRDAAFSSFSLHMDGKPVEGEILNANVARRQYEQIVRGRIDPGLLEFADNRTVRARIYPIPARGTKKLEIEYTQLLSADNSVIRYHYPLKTDKNAIAPDAVSLSLEISSSQGIQSIWSPSHRINTKTVDPQHSTVSYSVKGSSVDKDLVVYCQRSVPPPIAAVVTQKDSKKDGYFLLALTLPAESRSKDQADTLLLVDTSRSMQGVKLEQAKVALKAVIRSLDPSDWFNIIQFNTDVETFRTQLVPASSENRQAALEYVDRLESSGGTNFLAALNAADTMVSERTNRTANAIILTDGLPTVGPTSVTKLLEDPARQGLRLFICGLGTDVNVSLLDRLSRIHHGATRYAETDDSLESAVMSLFWLSRRSSLSDLDISVSGVPIRDTHPSDLKDLFAGAQALILGRYVGSGPATIRVSGKLHGERKEYSVPVQFAAANVSRSYLPRLWAMRKIGRMLDLISEEGHQPEFVDEIISLSKTYGIISPYTSFLSATEAEKRRAGITSSASRFSGGSVDIVGGSVNTSGGGGGSASARGGDLTLSALTGSVSTGTISIRSAAGGFDVAGAVLASGSSGGAIALSLPSGGVRVGGTPSPLLKARGLERFSIPTLYLGHAVFPPASDGVHLAGTALRPADIAALRELLRRECFAGIYTSSGFLGKQSLPQGLLSPKRIGDKLFVYTDGYWVDSAFRPADWRKRLYIEFASKKHLDLIRAHPELAKYFAAGLQVIVLFQGQCYQVVVVDEYPDSVSVAPDRHPLWQWRWW